MFKNTNFLPVNGELSRDHRTVWSGLAAENCIPVCSKKVTGNLCDFLISEMRINRTKLQKTHMKVKCPIKYKNRIFISLRVSLKWTN